MIAVNLQVRRWARNVVSAVMCASMGMLSTAWLSAAPSLREVLTPEEFSRAGLSKLSEAELAFLSERLLGSAPEQVAADADGPVAQNARPNVAEPARTSSPAAIADTFGREKQIEAEREQRQSVTSEIQSRISGVFTGWSGRTVFTLDNGQVWQQVEPALFSVNLESPVVTVRKGRFGAFYLGVEGYGSQVKVKRIR